MKNNLFFLLLCLVLCSNSALAAHPLPWQFGFQEAVTPVMEEINKMHNFLLVIISAIVLIVVAVMIYIIVKFNAKSNPVPMKFSHNVKLEIIWTIIPVIILIIIAIPSIKILRYAEKTADPDLTIKVVGYQWYWHYSYPEHQNIEFDSYMIPDSEIKPGQFRLLEVDNRVVIPVNKVVKFIITAADVIHSFAVPAFGIKTDAVPGRINETWVKVTKPGVYYGQCSELCGVNHGFMPIAIEVVSEEEFMAWVSKRKLSL